MKRAMERINLRRMAKISTVPAKLTSLSLKSQNKTKPSIITKKSENWKNFSRDENFYLKCALTVPSPTDASTTFSFVPATTPEATLLTTTEAVPTIPTDAPSALSAAPAAPMMSPPPDFTPTSVSELVAPSPADSFSSSLA